MKKSNGFARGFTFMITVLFLASCLFVGCKEQTTQFMVSYDIDGTLKENENFTALTLPESAAYDVGTMIPVPEAPEAVEGWTFDGWYINDTKVEAEFELVEDVTFVAKYIEDVADEEKDPADTDKDENQGDQGGNTGNQGGTSGDQGGNTGNQGGTSGDQGGSENQGGNGNENQGGNENENQGGNGNDGNEGDESEEVTTYKVTYVTDPDELTVNNLPVNADIKENETVVLPSLTLEGYRFDGWFDGKTEVDSPYKVTKAVTLTAKFTKVVEEVQKTTVRFKNNFGWTTVNMYIWNSGVEESYKKEWPGLEMDKMDKDENGWFSYTFTDENGSAYDKVIFNDGSAQTADLDFDYTSPSFDIPYPDIYLKPNTNWLKDNARFAAVFLNGDDWDNIIWVDMIADGDVYKCSVPNGVNKVQFCRMDPGQTANNWENKWNNSKTENLPTDANVLYTIAEKEDAWDESDGSWSTK